MQIIYFVRLKSKFKIRKIRQKAVSIKYHNMNWYLVTDTFVCNIMCLSIKPSVVAGSANYAHEDTVQNRTDSTQTSQDAPRTARSSRGFDLLIRSFRFVCLFFHPVHILVNNCICECVLVG
jgi:hypothetical protein